MHLSSALMYYIFNQLLQHRKSLLAMLFALSTTDFELKAVSGSQDHILLITAYEWKFIPLKNCRDYGDLCMKVIYDALM